MYVCPKCGKEYKKNVLRKCDYCKKVIGCDYCLTSGTLEYRYCDDHNPKPKKNKGEEILKFIKIFNGDVAPDEPLYKHAVLQLTKIANEEEGEGLNKIINIFKDSTKVDVSEVLIEGLIDVFKNVRSDEIIEPIAEYIDNSYLNDEFVYLPECIELLFKIKTNKAVEKIRELSEYPSVEIRKQILDVLSEISQEGEINLESEILKIYDEILAGRPEYAVGEIYDLIALFTDIDYRVRDNSVRELADKDSKKELLGFLNSSNPQIIGYTIRTLALKNELKNNDEKNNDGNIKEDEEIKEHNINESEEIKEHNINESEEIKEHNINEDEEIKDLDVDSKEPKDINEDEEIKDLDVDSKEPKDINEDEEIKDLDVDKKISEYIKHEDGFVRENVVSYLKSKGMYDKIFEAISDDSTNVRISALDALLEGGEHAKEYIDKIQGGDNEYAKNYITNEEMRYAENVKREIDLHSKYAKDFANYSEDEEAIEEYKEILKIDKNNAYAYLNLGEIYSKIYRYKEAEEYAKKHLEISKDSEGWNLLGRIYNSKGMEKEAIDAFKKSLAIENNFLSHRFLGEIEQRAKNFDEAIKEYNALLKINDIASIRSRISEILREQGKKEDAMNELQKGIDAFPDEIEFYKDLSMMLMDVQKLSDAEKLLRTAYRKFPYDAETAGMLASILFQLHKYSESEYLIRKVFAENPDVVKSEEHAILHEILGMSLGEQGKMTEATKELKTARHLNPSLGKRP